MNKIAVGVVAALAMGLASAGVYAAPDAGQAPYADELASIQTSSQNRFHPLAARSMPQAGELNEVAVSSEKSTLTRAQVRSELMQAMHTGDTFRYVAGEGML